MNKINTPSWNNSPHYKYVPEVEEAKKQKHKNLRVILFMPFGWFGTGYSAEELAEDVSITALVVIELAAGKICGLSTIQTCLTGFSWYFSAIKICSFSLSKSEQTALTIALRDIALGLSWFCTFFIWSWFCSSTTSSSLLFVKSTTTSWSLEDSKILGLEPLERGYCMPEKWY